MGKCHSFIFISIVTDDTVQSKPSHDHRSPVAVERILKKEMS